MKKLIALFLCLILTAAFCACTPEPENPSTGSQDVSASSRGSSSGGTTDSSSDSPSEEEPEDEYPNRVMGHNGKALCVYDLDLVEPGRTLDDAVIWSTPHGEGGDMKYREDTVFGDVIVTCGNGAAKIISYPEGKLLWSTTNPGNNSHAIEILPSGNIVIANSTGSTLRLFRTCVLVDDPQAKANSFTDYEFSDAHGVLWDPEYETLWALGNVELAGYSVVGTGKDETLVKVSGMGTDLPANADGGHDLSADMTNTQYLYLTVNSRSFRFHKESGELEDKFPQYAKLSKSAMKGLSNNRNGNFFYTQVNNGVGTAWENENFAAWCTDRITFGYWKSENFLYVEEYVSEFGNFYKCRAFCGQYQ